MRKLWWSCDRNHYGTIEGKVVLCRDEMAMLVQRVTVLHEKRFRDCVPTMMRVAPTRIGIENGAGAVTWRTVAGEQATATKAQARDSILSRIVATGENLRAWFTNKTSAHGTR